MGGAFVDDSDVLGASRIIFDNVKIATQLEKSLEMITLRYAQTGC